MRFATRKAMGAVVCALGLVTASGCASLHHKKANKPKCPEPPITNDVQNMPPLRVPTGLDAPDTRNAIKIPPLTEPQVARSPDAPCLSAPPSFGVPLEAYTGPSGPRVVSPFSWHVNAGGALTLGKSSDFLSTGWTLGGGMTYRRKPQSRFALQFDLGFADFNATRKLIDLAQQNVQYSIDSGRANVWLLSVAGKYSLPVTQNVGVYGLLGVGGYHESLQLTERALVGGEVCDPWGFCYVVATNADVSVASKSLTEFGWNAGLGVEFAHHGRTSWFVETRYHSVLGSRSVQFMPLQIGYRF